MTRKDYIAIAGAIKKNVDYVRENAKGDTARDMLGALGEVVLSLADTMQADNANFNRGQFIEACGF